jgi:hypothetical protein
MLGFERSQIKKIVQEVLAEMLGVSGQQNLQAGWVALKDAVLPLGYPSYKALHKDVSAGVFRMGKEVRDRRKPGAQKAVLQINIERAQRRLDENPANRRSI